MASKAGNIVDLGNGKYRLRYRGKSQNVTATSPRDLNRQLSAFVSEVDKGQFIQNVFTFKQFSEKWLKEDAEVNSAPMTEYKHKQRLENRIYDAIGNLRLEKVTPLVLTEFYNSMRQEGSRSDKKPGRLSERTIRLHHSTISVIFEMAIMWEVFNKTNPCKGVKFPEEIKQPAKFYDDKQIITMFKALETEDIEYRTAITLAIDSGVRIGELGGFHWDDFNFEKRLVTINKASQYLPGRGTFEKGPKTQNSYRTIILPKETMDLLEEYKKHQQARGFLCAENNPVFIKYNGKAKYTYWLTTWFPAFLKRHGLPHLNFHGTRHSSASYLLNIGTNINAVADRLGDTPATILNTYAHALRNSDKEAAESFSRLRKTE